MAFELKFSKFDNTPWGFRLTGGSDYGLPLIVVKVTEGSISDRIGLRNNDILLKVNEVDTTLLTHDEAHDIILKAGNNFVATVTRENIIPIDPEILQMSTNEIMAQTNTVPAPYINGNEQVPNWYSYSTQVSSKVYKPFSTYPNIPPLENPLILCPNQTVKQEWKESSSQQIKYNPINDNMIHQDKIDICEIEQSANEIVQENGVETVKSIVYENKCVTVIPVTVEKRDESAEIKTQEHTNVSKTETQKECSKVSKKEVQENCTKKTQECANISKTETKQQTVTLEDVKANAINAANVLSEQAKINGMSSFEGKKMGTVEAFETIAQGMQKCCFQVPCAATKQSEADVLLKAFFIHLTDVMVILTRMINSESGNCYTCVCSPSCACMQRVSQNIDKKCSANVQKESSTQEENVCKMHTINKTEVIETANTGQVLKTVIENIQSATGVDVTVNGKDPLEWLSDLDEQEKKIKQSLISEEVTENVKVEEAVFEKAKSEVLIEDVTEKCAASVQIEETKIAETVNAEIQEVRLEENHYEAKSNVVEESIKVDSSNIEVNEIKLEESLSNTVEKSEKVESLSSEVNEIVLEESHFESLSNKVEESIKVDCISAQAQEVMSKTVDVSIRQSEETQIQSSTEVILDTQDLKLDMKKPKQIIKEESTVRSPGWDVKVIPNDPQTPNTDEYLFRLDVKFKGKLADGPEHEPITEEPTLHEDLSIVRRPVFTIGDVVIESSKASVPDEAINKIDDQKRLPKPTSLNIKSVLDDTSNHSLTNTLTNTTQSDKSYNETQASAINSETNKVNSTILAENSASSSVLIKDYATSADKLASSASAAGFVSTISTNTANNQTSSNDKSVVSQTKENIKMEEEVVVASQESQSVKIEEKSEHMELSNMEEIKEMVMNEEITIESAPQTFTMGEQAKSFATTTMNGVQTIANGNCNQINGRLNDMEEDIGKPGLADEEIATIISGHAEQTKEQHVVGLQKVLASHMRRPDDEINKNENTEMLPMFGFLRDSEVFKALNEESLREKAERIQEERRKYTTFLQKPNRPIPYDKRMVQQLEFEEPPYRVNIKKQPKKDKSDLLEPSILSEGVFLVPEVPILIPEPTPQYFEAPEYLSDSSFPDLEDTGIPLPVKIPEPVVEENMPLEATLTESNECENKMETEVPVEETKNEHSAAEEDPWNENMICDDTIDENLTMEEQLTKVQKQLMALAKLPATIQQTIDIVTKQLSKMVPKLDTTTDNQQQEEKISNGEAPAENGQDEESTVAPTDEEIDEGCVENGVNLETAENVECVTNGNEHVENGDFVEAIPETVTNGVAEKEMNGHTEKKSEENLNLNEQQKIEKMKKDLIEELNEEHMMRQVKQRPSGRVGKPKPAFGPLVPQERPIVLPGGRKWKGPKDAFTDSFIAETLSGQAEVIMGKALGNHFEKVYPSYAQRVNFMKFNKPPIALGHLKESSVFKMVHDIDEPPHHGIQDRSSVVLAESEFREKCRSVTPSLFDNNDMPMES